MTEYKAHWSKSLVVVSLLATAMCLGAAYLVASQAGRGAASWTASLPLAILIGSALFTIRGYAVGPDAILVHRLLWTTRLPLAGLQSAKFDPDAMRRSIRTFGNGGFFSFTGFFRNKALGGYRAFVTDQNRTVVLRFSGRTVVLSPAEAEAFVRDVCNAAKLANPPWTG
jgi:hypothetical protein